MMIKLTTLLSGFLGTVVSLSFINERKKGESIANYLSKIILFVVSGTISSYYLTDIIKYHYSIPDNFDGSVGFISGLFGMSIISSIFKYKDMIIFSILRINKKK